MHEGEAEVSRHFASVGRRVVVVADSTKIERSTFARICPLDRIDVLVTDRPVPASFAADLASAGVEPRRRRLSAPCGHPGTVRTFRSCKTLPGTDA